MNWTTDELLARILARLERGDCPNRRWPDVRGDYWPLNPFRPDRRSGSFAVGPKGYFDFATGEGGSLAHLARRLGLLPLVDRRCPHPYPPLPAPAPAPAPEVLQYCSGSRGDITPPSPLPPGGRHHLDRLVSSEGGRGGYPPENTATLQHSRASLDLEHGSVPGQDTGRAGLTLEAYAAAKGLPATFLQDLGLSTVYLNGRPCVRIPYYDRHGVESGARFRLALTGKERFRWRKGATVQPYGVWRLDAARRAGFIVVVEGESDAQTLWYYGIPAIGVPGASTWRPEWAEALAGLTVYVWQEPDGGGEAVVRAVGESLAKSGATVFVIASPAGRKDINECHTNGDDVPDLLDRLMAEARPYQTLAAAQVARAAAEARQQAGELATCPDILARLEALLPQLGVVGEARASKLIYLALTSRLLPRPVSLVVKGPSSAGKSHLVGQLLQLFPEEAYLDLTSMSERALVYDQRPLRHRFIVLYEATGLGADRHGEVNTLAYCVRSLLSEGRLKYSTVEKTRSGLQARVIERPGPTGLITTTTWSSLHPENETRLLSITVRDDTEQTRNVLATLAARVNGERPAEPDLGPWRALQTWLALIVLGGRGDEGGEGGSEQERQAVTIPFAHELAAKVNPRAVRLRRDFGQVLTLIQAHALLHQATRQRDAAGRIMATLDDYRVVYELVSDLIAEGVEATVSPTVRATVQAVVDLHRRHDRPVSVAEVAAHLGLDRSAASRRVRVALERGFLVNAEDRRGRPAKLAPGEPLPDEAPLLPHPDDVSPPPAEGEGEGGEGGIYPPENTATLQHLADTDDDQLALPDRRAERRPGGHLVDEALKLGLMPLTSLPTLAADHGRADRDGGYPWPWEDEDDDLPDDLSFD